MNPTTFVCLLMIVISSSFATAQPRHYSLDDLHRRNQLVAVNRTISLLEKPFEGIRLSEAPGEGIAWLKDVIFSTGTIQIDLHGQDVFQRSFLGVAFHGVNDSTYEAVYFRPFNFLTQDTVRKIHAVQYISHPGFTWRILRTEKNGIYEKALVNPPFPDKWFRARIVVDCKTVAVFVNNDQSPSLVIEQLNPVCEGKIGLWTGDGSGGEFRHMIISVSQENERKH